MKKHRFGDSKHLPLNHPRVEVKHSRTSNWNFSTGQIRVPLKGWTISILKENIGAIWKGATFKNTRPRQGMRLPIVETAMNAGTLGLSWLTLVTLQL